MPIRTDRLVVATATALSTNAKIGDAAATYAAQQSCPTYCPFFKGGGCYAEDGQVYMGVTKRLNDDATTMQLSGQKVAQFEADAIDDMQVIPGRPMRLHTVGDCATDEAALVVSAAAERYMDNGGGQVWAYTHAWRVVDRASWGRVSVLASCESAEQVELARARGYAPSIVVEEFDSHMRYVNERGLAILPCPAQTRDDVTCSSCKLCMNDQAIRERGYAIGFHVHGSAFAVRQAKATLRDPGDPDRKRTLRQRIPEYLAAHPDATTREMAVALGYNESSVGQMRRTLEAGR